MRFPLFYMPGLTQEVNTATLDEATSKHVVQVLRMGIGRQLQLTNGKGSLHTVEITDDNRKRCAVKMVSTVSVDAPSPRITIAISPVKNNSRFEWFLEKATEIGVTGIVPVICERTEKQQLKFERMQQILISAMLQSQQTWLPELQQPVKFRKYLGELNLAVTTQKFIAHCEDAENKKMLSELKTDEASHKLILIGPEGDFTSAEINSALETGLIPVALGQTRLRTETAGIVAATLLANF